MRLQTSPVSQLLLHRSGHRRQELRQRARLPLEGEGVDVPDDVRQTIVAGRKQACSTRNRRVPRVPTYFYIRIGLRRTTCVEQWGRTKKQNMYTKITPPA